MQTTPLIQTFRTLGQRDRHELEKFVNSPVFNQRDDVKRLFRYLCAHVPPSEQADSGHTVLTKMSVYEQIFPNTPGSRAASYDDASMRYAMSFLFKVIKQYLAYQGWVENELDPGLHLCRALRKRGLDKIYEKEYRALAARYRSDPHQSADHFFRQYQLRLEYWEVFQRSERGGETNLKELGDTFGAFVAASVLRQGCAMLAKPGNQESVQMLAYLPETLTAAEDGKFDHVPAVLVYFRCFKMLSGDEPQAHFSALRAILEQHWMLFPQHETRDIYVAAINFCIRQLNAGIRSYIREALDLYRSGLERNIIFEDGHLSKYTYNNILLLALASEEWDWAQQFLEDYRSALPQRDRDSAYRYNLATYYFRKKDYSRAQEILRHVEFRDTFYNLDARRMLVRIYFDTGESAALESLLDSFTIYLRRKRASLGYHKDLNLNFVRFVKSILRLQSGDDVSRKDLKEKILEAKYLAEREWLLGKI
jgi:hypothetical protein